MARIHVINQGPRKWDAPDEFEYKGSHVVLEQWTHKYEGLVVTQVQIDGDRYPYLHGTKMGAQDAALRIIDKNPKPRIEL